MPGGPAALEGSIPVGGALLAVDGVDVTSLDGDAIGNLIRGEDGSKVPFPLKKGSST